MFFRSFSGVFKVSYNIIPGPSPWYFSWSNNKNRIHFILWAVYMRQMVGLMSPQKSPGFLIFSTDKDIHLAKSSQRSSIAIKSKLKTVLRVVSTKLQENSWSTTQGKWLFSRCFQGLRKKITKFQEFSRNLRSDANHGKRIWRHH